MSRVYRLLLVLSLLVLAALSIRTIKLDLPYRYNGDEDYFYTSAMKIRGGESQIMSWYPPLSPYVTAAISLTMDIASGGTQYAGDVATAAPTYLAGRLFSVFCLLLACCFLYRIGKLLHSPAAGLAILWLFAVDSEVFIFSYTIRGDMLAYMFMSASIFFTLLALQRPQIRSLIWWASGTMVLAIVGKYTVAPLGVFPAYLWLQRFLPSVRKQIIVVGTFVLLGIGGLVVITSTSLVDFVKAKIGSVGFNLPSTLLSFSTLQTSLNQVQVNQAPLFLLSALLLTILVVLIYWRIATPLQRRAYILFVSGVAAVVFVGAMVSMRYRDIFILPYALMILWAMSFGILGQRYLKSLAIPALFLATFIFAGPAYAANFHSSNVLMEGDRRVDASHWLESNVHVPTGIVKERTANDFLPQSSGYPAGYQSWQIVPSILEKSAQEWWNEGFAYSIADDDDNGGAKKNGWFDQTINKNLYDGFSLAYQTPDQMQGPGPRIAIFYNFPIKTQVNLRFVDLAQVFGFNVNQRNICVGQQLGMRVFMRALRTTDIFYQTEIVLRDSATGKAVITDRQTPVLGQRPSTVWEKYELLFDDHWLQIPMGLKAGNYSLEMALYEPYHGNRVSVLDSANNPQFDFIPMGQVEVADSCSVAF